MGPPIRNLYRRAPRPGTGTEASRLVLDYAFHVLQLRNVMLETLAWNSPGLKAPSALASVASAWARRESDRREADHVVLMDAVPEDFGASTLR